MPSLDSYLFFTNRQCAQAMQFYERTLGGRIETFMKHGEAPPPQQCPAGAEGLVMHCSLKLADRTLMACDVPPTMGGQPMRGFSLSLGYDSVDEARRVFDALSQGGQVTMPMTRTFWAEAFGMLVDRFGTPWMVGGGVQGS
jgi:PhnB protein